MFQYETTFLPVILNAPIKNVTTQINIFHGKQESKVTIQTDKLHRDRETGR